MFSRTSPSTGPGSPEVTGFHHEATGSVMYVLADPATRQAALVDIVQDYDPAEARASHDSAQKVLDFCAAQGLEIAWILDTHPHADHLMAAAWLKARTGAPIAIGEKVRDIAALWADLYHLPDAFDPDRDFDRLLADGETLSVGGIGIRVMLSPGHTMGSITYVAGDAAFVHDTFMHVDAGTTRADFPGGSSAELYDSLMAILALPDGTRLFVGHDYPPVGDRSEPAWEATVADHRAHNAHVGGGVTKAAFRDLRDTRDATLKLPDRMLAALQVNLRGGRLPPAEADGHSYLKVPLNRF
ncbi:MBL fold metallo-hydrolase [Wenxinia saemankumensis]|uniref:Glyoxylase, beta-lactamase superfamily II n=1 Tax=Wenxinia saemankumensis TaxID=1447782 RepID=A0A1M6EPT0_9RHOB|nr:MBL fold metallo-hydrolase [Wenxinia saemankumensis]SHI87547.1 Glyoxylase, beta-lactamase superfamily II [Wenxinia saemankumensis]